MSATDEPAATNRPGEVAPLPGDTAISRVRVYDWPTPDDEHGGSAHTHLVCTEAYVVVAGSGRLQTLGPHGFAEVGLQPGQVVWFTPGVIHRPVNDGDLEILVVMQNSGLPEAGDAVLTFPPQILADPKRYAEEVSAVSADRVFASSEERARQRRDLAIEGFVELRAAVEEQGPEALTPFYRAARDLVAPKLEQWEKLWRNGPRAAAERTGAQLAALARGDIEHLANSPGVFVDEAGAQPAHYGMCGRLSTHGVATARAVSDRRSDADSA